MGGGATAWVQPPAPRARSSDARSRQAGGGAGRRCQCRQHRRPHGAGRRQGPAVRQRGQVSGRERRPIGSAGPDGHPAQLTRSGRPHFSKSKLVYDLQESRLTRVPALERTLKLASITDAPRSPVDPLDLEYDREKLEDVGFMTCMTLVLLGNYAQTGHFGGPLAYTPYNVAVASGRAGVGRIALRLSAPQAPLSATSSCWRAGTAFRPATRLWMIMGQAMERKYTGDGRSRAITWIRRWRSCRLMPSGSAAARAH